MIKSLSKITPKYSDDNHKLKIAIIRSNYHAGLTKSMEKACRAHLISLGVKEENIETFEVPGSWEIPLVTKKVAKSKKYDGIVVFGVIIKGDTYHFEMIATQSSHSLMNIALEFNIAITFEVLATYNLVQARTRSIGKYNKGKEAAAHLLETIRVLSKI